MKARTRYQKQVAAANERLTALRPDTIAWATRNAVEHIAFRTAGHNCTCGDCGEQFNYEGGAKYIRCPPLRTQTVGERLSHTQDETVGLFLNA